MEEEEIYTTTRELTVIYSKMTSDDNFFFSYVSNISPLGYTR